MSALLDALVGDAALAAWFTDDADLTAMLAFESALAAVQAAHGLIPDSAAHTIGEACERFRPDWDALRAGMARDGVVGPSFVALLRRTLAPEAQQFLHLGATSQDAVDTSLVLRLKPVVAELSARLEGVISLLRGLRDAQGDVPMMGHTRMQRALPITAGDKLDAWCHPLRRHAERLPEMRRHLLVVQLGGPVGTQSDLAPALAERLGLAAGPSWHTARDGVVGFGQWLALVAGSLGKIGQDVALLAQASDVRLPGGGASSAMPHKSNPVSAEMLVALARHTAGLSATLAQAMVHEQERSGAAWMLEWLTLPTMVVATGASLRHAASMLERLSFVVSAA